MSMKGDLPLSSERGIVRVFGRLPDGLAGKINDHLRLAPADTLYPFRSDQDSLPGQPVARIDDQVADRPGPVVDEEILDVADLASPSKAST